MKKSRVLSIGEMSSGTMRDEDLVPIFLDLCNELRLSKSDRAIVSRIRRYMCEPKSDYNATAEYAIALWEMLENHCPPYCYFGSIEGDGACYGVWPSVDMILDDASNGEIRHIDKAEKGYRGYVVSISDHGNVTLYDRRAFGHGYKDTKIWSIV